jgi:hypothetical protein
MPHKFWPSNNNIFTAEINIFIALSTEIQVSRYVTAINNSFLRMFFNINKHCFRNIYINSREYQLYLIASFL